MLAADIMDSVVQLDPQVWGYVVGVILPILTALVTKSTASSRVKSLCTLVLATATGVITSLLLVDGGVTVGQIVSTAFQAYVAAIATYYGLWKPTGAAPAVSDKTSKFGLG